jgi:hypothetical protein
MKREHAEITTNVALLNQIVPDPYVICPGYGGISSSIKVMEFFLEFLDSLYDIYSVEIHNPAICNVNHITGILMDRFGTPINLEELESIQVEDQLFIDLKYPKNLLKLNGKKDNVEAIKLNFDETKDGNNPRFCELRVFGRKTGGKDVN